jgi:mRNA (guanine-N7-)-methyltransferase
MLSNISQNLSKGGYFIGTTLNSNRIVKKLRESKDSTFGNPVFQVKFECEEPFPLFGAKYLFQLEEVVNCPEFLVNFPALER